MRWRKRIGMTAACAAISAAAATGPSEADQPAGDARDPDTRHVDEAAPVSDGRTAPEPPQPAALAAAPAAERESMERLLASADWPRRALAALRLERFACDESRTMLTGMIRDPAWQVQAFAVRALARRRVPQGEDWFTAVAEPRVARAALRHRYALDPLLVGRGARKLFKSGDVRQMLLGVELALASDSAPLASEAIELFQTVILRMNRGEAGAMSARLADFTAARGLTSPFDWQRWLRQQGRSLTLRPAFALPEGDEPIKPAPIAAMTPERFADLEGYVTSLEHKPIDLALVLDCTGSMSGELSAVQGGIDDLMLFVRDVVGSLRVAVVAYRDRHEEFEVEHADFTDNLEEARRRLWVLTADGGGDRPEAVHPALERAYTGLHWDLSRSMVLILAGDAPPHVGYGRPCAQLAERAARSGVTTHTIQADDKPVEHYEAIATAGGGRCVNLRDDASLVAEITGLALGDRFNPELQAMFAAYLELCR
jgi:von Willebrand factor type A domain